jgi:DNA-binding HxlR family transcriptional regulator
MKGYGQFCPIAKASEILAERWTFLVLRELILGSSRFNDLRRGVPLMSSSLLSQRLKFLEREGVVGRRPAQAGSGLEYHLTAAGRELEPVIIQLGEWGARWVRSRLGAEDLDVALLIWDMHRNVRPEHSPARRVVVAFEFTDVPQSKRRWWLVSDGKAADLCVTDPGFEVDLLLISDLRTMTAIWVGDLSLTAALNSGALETEGPVELRRRLEAWLALSLLASIKSMRPAAKVA